MLKRTLKLCLRNTHTHSLRKLYLERMLAWAGGSGGPDFFIALADHAEWGHSFTVWGELHDAAGTARCSCSNGPFEVPVSSCASTPPSDCQLRLICGWVSARWSSNEAADAADPAGASCGSSLLASSSGSSPLASARCAPEASRCSLSPGALSFSASGENALPPPRPLRLAEGPAGIGGSAVSGRLPSRASLPAQTTSAADACIRSSRWSGGAIASCDGKDGV